MTAVGAFAENCYLDFDWAACRTGYTHFNVFGVRRTSNTTHTQYPEPLHKHGQKSAACNHHDLRTHGTEAKIDKLRPVVFSKLSRAYVKCQFHAPAETREEMTERSKPTALNTHCNAQFTVLADYEHTMTASVAN